MSEENVELARDAYNQFNSGNPGGVIEKLADNLEWVEPGGGNAAKGTFTTPDSVANDVFSTIPEQFEEFSCEPDDFKDEGDNVIVTGRFKGKSKSGKELDAGFEHTWEMSDGKITKLNNGVKDTDNWAEAWS